jgi:PASTA domain
MRMATSTLACGLLFVVVGLAAAASELDQQQTVIYTGGAGYIGGSTGQRVAQTITPAIPGLLTELHLAVSCPNQSSLLVEIRDVSGTGTPGSTVVASQTVPGSALPPPSTNFKAIAFANPPFLPAEETFAATLALIGSGSCEARLSRRGVDAYPRGGPFYADPPAYQWIGPEPLDFAFKTFVDRRCRVPELDGTALTEIARTLAQNGCSAGPVRRAFSRSVPAGTVISQSPQPGGVVAAGSPVAVVVSRGRPPCIVPRLRGKTLRQARVALARGSCRLGRVTRRPAARTRRGRVIGQRPAPGRRLPDRSRVNIVLGR